MFAEVPALLCHETRERETVGQADAHAEGTAVGLAVFVRLTQHEGTQVACPWPCERMASTSAEHLAGFEEGISSFPANAEHVVDGGKRLKCASWGSCVFELRDHLVKPHSRFSTTGGFVDVGRALGSPPNLVFPMSSCAVFVSWLGMIGDAPKTPKALLVMPSLA